MHFLYIAMLVIQIVGPIIFYVLRLLGIGAVTYVGINLVLDQVKDYLIGNFVNVPLQVQQLLGLAKFDVAINIYLAAVTARLLLAGYDKATAMWAKRKYTFTA
jgi:hypothetical protein